MAKVNGVHPVILELNLKVNMIVKAVKFLKFSDLFTLPKYKRGAIFNIFNLLGCQIFKGAVRCLATSRTLNPSHVKGMPLILTHSPLKASRITLKFRLCKDKMLGIARLRCFARRIDNMLLVVNAAAILKWVWLTGLARLTSPVCGDRPTHAYRKSSNSPLGAYF